MTVQPVGTIAHTNPVRLIEFGPDELRVTADVQMQAIIWRGSEMILSLDLNSPNPRHRPHDRVRSAAFDLMGRTLYLATGCRLIAIDVESGEVTWTHESTEWWPFMLSTPMQIAVNASDEIVVSFDNATMERWTSSHGQDYRRRDRDVPTNFALDQKMNTIVGTDGYCLTSWNQATGLKTKRFSLDDTVYGFAYSSRTQIVAVRTVDSLQIRSLVDGSVVEKFTVGGAPPLVGLEDHGPHLAYASESDILIRNLDSGKVRRIENMSDRFVTLRFDLGGNLWTGHANGDVKKWEPTEWQTI